MIAQGPMDNRMTTPSALPGTASPGKVYAGRLAARRCEHQILARRHGRLSAGRRLLLGALVVLVILVEKEGPLARFTLTGGLALLLVSLILRRARTVRAMRRSQW